AEFADKHPDILPPVMATKALDVIEAHQQSFRYAVEAGVNIAMGTDTGVGKHGNNGRELQLMVENGMSSMQAIVASTQNAARLLHMDNAIGTLEAGKLADILVVKGDVLADISTIVDKTNILLVLKGGHAAKNTFEQRVPMMAGIA
ncbi:MAG TPA: amidohydrolase family protein, partial [Ktedonobacteraceae bacterium]|nr:amidohydrolase family protein [Ktedonobacteraceae bacterium]